MTTLQAPEGASSDAAPTGTPGPSGASRRGGPRRRSSRWWRVGFPVALVVLVVAIPVLVWAGVNVVLDSNAGHIERSVTDPGAPGWEAAVEPTPSLLVVAEDESGDLDSLWLQTLTGDGSGGMVAIPASSLLDVPGVGKVALDAAYGRGGIQALRPAAEAMVGTQFTDVVVIQSDEWAQLVKPVGSLTVSNPDTVTTTGPTGPVTFDKGVIQLAPNEVWPYLRARNPGESQLNRLIRQESFWRAWLAAVAAHPGDGTVPGETDSGLGRFVRALASSQVEYSTLPVEAKGLVGSTEYLYEPVEAEVAALMDQLVPFAVAAPPGSRPLVRVLDGAGLLDHGLPAAPALVAAGAQIDTVGNAARFDFATTQVIYYDDLYRDAAEQLARALGVGEVVKSEEVGESVSFTVILGSDFTAAGPSSSQSLSTLSIPTTRPAGG